MQYSYSLICDNKRDRIETKIIVCMTTDDRLSIDYNTHVIHVK